VAIGNAKANDEVIVTAGAYAVGSTIFPPGSAQNLSIHGDPGGPMPAIQAGFEGAPIVLPSGGRISYLEIDNSKLGAYGVFCPPEGLFERLVVRVTGESSIGMLLNEGCTARNSLIRVAGPSSTAVFAYASAAGTTIVRARNLTAVATGPKSQGLSASYAGFEGTLAFDAKNLIAAGDEDDLVVGDSGGGVAQLTIAHSIFDSTLEEGKSTIAGSDNQVGPALFVEPVLGDFHQAAGSPSIDAGVADLVGPLDLDGNPRVLGGAPDIGAYELVPPPTPGAPAAAAGSIRSLRLSPTAFRAARSGGAIASAGKRRRPVGSRVSYSLSAPAKVAFSVERKTVGRRAGKRCAKATKANRRKKRCVRFVRIKGSFSDDGEAGLKRFKLSGRLRGKALRPDAYRLVGKAGGAARRASFRIVR
jgi:hypothetical protein